MHFMINKHELQKYGGHGKVKASEESKILPFMRSVVQGGN